MGALNGKKCFTPGGWFRLVAMSSSLLLGLVAACGCALASTFAALLKFRGARQAPEVNLGKPGRATFSLFKNRLFLAGILLGSLGGLCNAAALALAPLTLVKPITAGSLVLLGVAASLMLGVKVTNRQRIGLLLVAAGLAGIVLTAEGHSTSGSAQGVIMFEGIAMVVGLLLVGVARMRKSAFTLAVAGGVLGGSADALVKHLPHSDLGLAISSGLLLMGLGVAGMLLAARALQLGDALPTIATLAVAGNLTSIASGFVVFGERLPSGALEIIVQVGALMLVLGALALVPQPSLERQSA